jgi:hypothetical protein
MVIANHQQPLRGHRRGHGGKEVRFTKQAQKDARKLAAASPALKAKAEQSRARLPGAPRDFCQPHGLMLQRLTAFRSRLDADGTTWLGKVRHGNGEHDKAR